MDLATELAEGNLSKTLQQLLKLDLILDELGYIPFDNTSSQLLFNIVSNSYPQQIKVITSNLEFGR
jgi:DNA replication protein DnaC